MCNIFWEQMDDLLALRHPRCWTQKIFTKFYVSFKITLYCNNLRTVSKWHFSCKLSNSIWFTTVLCITTL